MDKEQAMFILRSFRPDGADADDHDFAEALALALEDRELGEWLARERAFDSTFAQALASVSIPESLRGDVFNCLTAGNGGFPVAEDRHDSAMIGALSTIQPPTGLREEILTAMHRSRVPATVSRPVWRRLAIPLAAAAGVALAFLITRQQNPNAEKQISGIELGAPVPVEVVQAGFIRTYESPLFSFDETRDDHQALIRHLRERKLPCPGNKLPDGIHNLKGVGCRELIIDGKRGSLICFEECGKGVVHLVVFRREDVCGELPDRAKPDFNQVGHWAAARWGDDQRVFILIAATEVSKLASLF
jgi:hypothetical protein